MNKEADSQATVYAKRAAARRQLAVFDANLKAAAAWTSRQLDRLVQLQGRYLLDNEDLAALHERWHVDYDPAGRRGRS